MLRQAFYDVLSQAMLTHMILVNCRGFDDPDASSELRRHIGDHPTILKGLVKSSMLFCRPGLFGALACPNSCGRSP